MDAQDTTSITRLQALRERWAMVRGKIATAWPRVRAFFSPWQSLHTVVLLLGATWLAFCFYMGVAAQKAQTATEQTAAAAAVTLTDLATFERRVSALEAQLALSPWPSPALAPVPAATPSRRAPAHAAPAAAAHAAPFTGPADPQADAAPAPGAWGPTDLDRAIQQFAPPPAAQ